MVIINEFVKVGEAAQILGFSVQHTRFLIRQGSLRGTKISRDWIIAREALDEFVARRNTVPLLPAETKGRPLKIMVSNRKKILVTKEKRK